MCIRDRDEPEAIYTVNESFFDLTAGPSEWISFDFFSVNGIESITLQPAADDTINGWTASRPNAGSDFTIHNLKAGRQPQTDKLTAFKSVLTNPRFEDVLSPEAAKEKRDESKARQLTLKTFEGFTYLLDYAPAKPEGAASEAEEPLAGALILNVTVTTDFPSEREKKEGESEEEAKKADADFATTQKELKKKLTKEEALNAHYYLIADYNLAALNIGLDAIAKPVVKTEAIAPSTPRPPLGPLAPQPPIGQSPPAPEPPRPSSAVSPPVAIPSSPSE